MDLCWQATDELEAQLKAAQKARESSEAQAAQLVEAENKVCLILPKAWRETFFPRIQLSVHLIQCGSCLVCVCQGKAAAIRARPSAGESPKWKAWRMQIMELESARAEAQAEARSLAAELDSLRSEGGSPSPSPTVRPPLLLPHLREVLVDDC